jgi:outer membrane protein assembly factor BamA
MKLIVGLTVTFLLALCPLPVIGGDEDAILLERLQVEGNRVTDSSYLLSHVTLKEGVSYDIDALMDEINRSRENLERTGLFTEVFFNDELDEDDNLLLTITVKEKNYLFFGPGGQTGYEEDVFYFRNSLYLTYNNLFGNSTTIYAEVPFYENQGVRLLIQGGFNRSRYELDLEYEHRAGTNLDTMRVMPGFAYAIDRRLYIGVNVLINNATYNSFALYPYLELGSDERFSRELKSWYFLHISPYYGYNFQGIDAADGENVTSSFYGIGARFSYFRDLLLKIVYQLKVNAELQSGGVPSNLVLESDARGTRFDAHTGDKKLSVTNEVHVPLPWEESIVIVPFIDLNVIGYNKMEALIGGGVGLHWYNRFQDPLIVEIAFGRGIMLNFQKRL